MKVMVTGADGYIGAILAPRLAARGHEVAGFDAGFFREAGFVPPPAPPPAIVARDTRGIEPGDLAGFDAVVHLADLSNDPLGELRPQVTRAINHLGAVRVAVAARSAGVRRFLFSSSCSVYGAGGDDWRTEESAVAPQTVYAECKVLVERDVAALADDGFCPVFLRNATAYGLSPRMRFDLVLNNLAGLAWVERNIRMTSDGSPWRPLVHVEDIAEAFACALEAPDDDVRSQVFNVGDSRYNYRVRDIAEVVGAAFPGCDVTFGEPSADRRSYRVSFDRIHDRLPGFQCRRDIEETAAEMRAVFERIGLTRDDFESRLYTRLKQLHHLIDRGLVDEDFRWTGGRPADASAPGEEGTVP